jgi:hypothetical protein
MDEFVWRDKAIELLIRTLHSYLDDMSITDYFLQFDDNHNKHLSPNQFRSACLALNEPQLKKNQIDRLMHILLEEKK